MKEILLTQGKVAIVDDEDFEFLNQWKWHVAGGSGSGTGYARRSIRLFNNKIISFNMHRVVMNPKNNEQIDHVNGNKFDNRKSNLRICTNTQNQHNVPLRKDNKSGFKGVNWDKKTRKWHTRIRVDGNRFSLGYFNNKEQAALAYNEAALQYHGEFARLNSIEQF